MKNFIVVTISVFINCLLISICSATYSNAHAHGLSNAMSVIDTLPCLNNSANSVTFSSILTSPGEPFPSTQTYDDAAFSGIQTSSSGYVNVGYSRGYPPFGTGQDIQITHLNAIGNNITTCLKNNNFSSLNSETLTDVIQINGKGPLMATGSVAATDDRDLLIKKFDLGCNIYCQNQIGYPGFLEEGKSLIEDSERNIIVVGSVDEGPLDMVLVVKTDGNCSTQWIKKYYLLEGDAVAHDIVEVKGLRGATGTAPYYAITGEWNEYVFIFIIDSNGQPLYPEATIYNIGGSLSNSSIGYGIIQDDNNDLVVTGVKREASSPTVAVEQPFILKIDPNSNNLFSGSVYCYDIPGGNEQARDIVLTDDGNYIIAGKALYNDAFQTIPEEGRAIALKVDQNLNSVLWANQYGFSSHLGSKFYHIDKTSDKGFYFVGTTWFSQGLPTPGTLNDFFSIKTDSEGLLSDCECYQPIEAIPGVQLRETLLRKIYPYDHPFENKIGFDAIEVEPVQTFCEQNYCIDIAVDSFVCVGEDYKLYFNFTNTSLLPVCQLEITFLDPSTAVVNPDPIVFPGCIAPGMNSGSVCLDIKNIGPGGLFKLAFKTKDVESIGCLTDALCLEIPACPCDTIKPVVSVSSNSPLCEGMNIVLQETGGDAVAWSWTGPGTLDDPSTWNPRVILATTANSGTYCVTITDVNGCTSTDCVYVLVEECCEPVNLDCNDTDTLCTILGNELVFNGDFSLGNTGFIPGLPLFSGCLTATYWVDDNARDKCMNSLWEPVQSPTCDGNYMIVDGANGMIWEQNLIPVTPGATYKIGFSVYPDISGDPAPMLGLRVNNTPVLSVTPPTDQWNRYCINWTAPPGISSITLSVVQIMANGFADYGIDDISVKECLNGERGFYSPRNNEPMENGSNMERTEMDKNDNIIVYPNPTNDRIIIALKANVFNESDCVEVFDITGKEVLNLEVYETASKIELNLKSLPLGLYSLKIKTGEKISVRKILKQ